MTPPPTLLEAAARVRSRSQSAAETIGECLDGIDRLNPALNAFREVNREHALARAASIDQRLAAGEDVGPLAGAPIAVKDNIVTDFGRTCCGSRLLERFESPYSATVIQRLERAGAIVVGKTNCDEFAMGSSTENCAFGVVRNPCDHGRVPGGSSGGSAVAVATGMTPAALGSDTGGSVRQPAAFCGVVGVKPSYGRVSRSGLVAYGSSLDQVGPIAANLRDAAALLQAIAGVDPDDPTSSDQPVPDFLAEIDRPFDDLRIGLPKQYLDERNHPAVNEAVRKAADVFRRAGATIVDIDLPMTSYGIATYYVIATAEASSNLARFDGIRYGRRASVAAGEDLTDLYSRSRSEGLGAEVQRRIMLGTYVLSAGYYEAHYRRALQVRRLIRDEFSRAFDRCHALLGPTSPIPAFRLGERADPLTMYLCDAYTVNANIAGICGLSLNGGFVEEQGKRLPIGLQLQCRAFDEATLFGVGRLLEGRVG